MEDSTTDDSHSFEDLQIELTDPLKEEPIDLTIDDAHCLDIIHIEPLKEEAEDTTMDDAHCLEDLKVEPVDCLTEEAEKSTTSQTIASESATASVVDNQIEPIVLPQEEPERPIASESITCTAIGVNSEIEPIVLPQEEPEIIVASESVTCTATSVDGQIEPIVLPQVEPEKSTLSQSSSAVGIPIESRDPIIEQEEETEGFQPTNDDGIQIEPTMVTRSSSRKKRGISPAPNDSDLQPYKNFDQTATFTNNTVFDSREELINWARDIGKTVGTIIAINKSEKSTPGRNPRIIIGCERGGKYRNKKGCVPRPEASKRCGCPFLLKGIKMPKGDQWTVTVKCGYHNHPITQNFEKHSYAGRLTSEEKQIAMEMAKGGAKPKDVLNALKERNVHNASNIKTIYNALGSLKANELSISEMQQSPEKAVEHEYVEWHGSHNKDDLEATMDDAHAFDDLQIEPTETSQEEPKDYTMEDAHSFDNLQIEPVVAPQEVDNSTTSQPTNAVLPQQESEKPIASESSSYIDCQTELTVTLDQDAQVCVLSEATTDVDIPIESTVSLQETQEMVACQFMNGHDVQIEPIKRGRKRKTRKKLVASQPTHDADLESFEAIDMTDTFTTDTIFDSREELINWARDTGKSVGTIIAINKSEKGTPGRKPRIVLGCERGGKYRVKKDRRTPARPAGSKRCGCPFLLKGIKMPKDDQWKVTVSCGLHNHPITQDFGGHSYAGKLTLEEKEIVMEMAKGGAKPKDVLNALKERNVHNASKLKTIYNARIRLKLNALTRRSEMQQLLKKVAEHEYVEWHRSHEEEDSVGDLIWAHPESIKLAKCFPHVFIMDCTYLRNKCKPSVLEIVGVTSTNKTFSFAFIYLAAEKEDNYVWGLERIKSILSSGVLPSVFVTDKEVTLMNAIKRVFPDASNLLCRHHILKDLGLNCKKMFNTNEPWNSFLSRWNNLVFSSTEEEYLDQLSALERDFSEYSDALSYVKETWLSNYKECFIAAWTDQSTHFGNTTIRAEDSDQARLKRHLGSTQGTFNTMWSAINSLLLLQQSEINASFNESLSTVMNDYTSTMFEELKGSVSIVALDLVLMESKLADSFGTEDSVCGCAIRQTHGLPCSHEISRYKHEGCPIPLSCIHPHWKNLSTVPTLGLHPELNGQPEYQMLHKTYEEADENVKIEILKKIEEIATLFLNCKPTS